MKKVILNFGGERHELTSDELHSYQARQGCMVCSKCGTAKHKGKLDGFKFWFAGIGYVVEPPCRNAT